MNVKEKFIEKECIYCDALFKCDQSTEKMSVCALLKVWSWMYNDRMV